MLGQVLPDLAETFLDRITGNGAEAGQRSRQNLAILPAGTHQRQGKKNRLPVRP
jgi:hypothetical protein